MKVLIAGGGGQVGRALLRSVPSDHAVHAPDRRELDITSEESVRATVRKMQPDVIVNVAAYTAVDRAESEVDQCNQVNAQGAQYLAQCAQECGARLLQVSTDYVFDGTSTTPYQADASPRPLNVYGESKLRGERAVLETLADRAVVLRTAWVYAAAGSNFLRTMLRLMSERRQVRVVSDQVGSPTAARSIADVLWRLVARTDAHGIHHWTDAGVASWYDFAVAIAEEGAALKLLPPQIEVSPISTQEYPTPARRPAYSVLDKRATCALLGLQPVHWRTSLRAVMSEIASG
ncbi:MAG TPA: dTDP-4-dehydrorhamnose reductase [Steroidobacteraceae bacterium]|nr:dTDP-4-dehydrorhamnose reductase [Steroidobacteraceae bacterium]